MNPIHQNISFTLECEILYREKKVQNKCRIFNLSFNTLITFNMMDIQHLFIHSINIYWRTLMHKKTIQGLRYRGVIILSDDHLFSTFSFLVNFFKHIVILKPSSFFYFSDLLDIKYSKSMSQHKVNHSNSTLTIVFNSLIMFIFTDNLWLIREYMIYVEIIDQKIMASQIFILPKQNNTNIKSTS